VMNSKTDSFKRITSRPTAIGSGDNDVSSTLLFNQSVGLCSGDGH
jgi:hypothetical protein